MASHKTTINRWLASPPSTAPLMSTSDRPSEQLNAAHMVSMMNASVTAVYLAPSARNSDGGFLPRLLSTISRLYSEATNSSVKTVAIVDNFYDYEVNNIPHVSNTDFISVGTQVLITTTPSPAAKKAIEFGNAVICCYIKNGSCIDNACEQNLRDIARAVKSERFHRLLVICDTPSTVEELRRAKDVIGRLEINYGEITW